MHLPVCEHPIVNSVVLCWILGDLPIENPRMWEVVPECQSILHIGAFFIDPEIWEGTHYSFNIFIVFQYLKPALLTGAFLFYCCSITVVPIFSPLLSSALLTYPHLPLHLPPSVPHPIIFVHLSFIHVPWPFPFFPPLSPSPIPSVYCQFFISVYLVVFCSLVCFVD